jgi:hypothetical protein
MLSPLRGSLKRGPRRLAHWVVAVQKGARGRANDGQLGRGELRRNSRDVSWADAQGQRIDGSDVHEVGVERRAL